MNHPLSYTLKGKIKCGCCGLSLAYHPLIYDSTFCCPHGISAGDASNCYKGSYSERDIERAVFKTLCQKLKEFVILQDSEEKAYRDRNKELRNRIREIRKRIEILQMERIRVYEAFADGHISRDIYIKKKEKMTYETDQLKKEANTLAREADDADESRGQINEIVRIAECVMAEDGLTRETADRFIDTVYVHDPSHIEVKFIFEDLIENTAENMEGEVYR